MLRYFASLMLLLAACGEPIADGADVRVRSEVRLDGVTELFARSAGDVVIESVLMHASAARVEDGDEKIDLLEDDISEGGALVFQYAPNAEVDAEERAWPLRNCSPEAALFFDFAPQDDSQEDSDARLENHTIVVTGFLYVDAERIESRFFDDEKNVGVQALNNHEHRFGSDPDTMPDDSDKFGSDPDTMPDDSDKFGSDPDTMPDDSDEYGSDPDTMPDDSDKFGSDPDTMPDDSDEYGSDPDTMPDDTTGMPMANVKGQAESGRRVRLPFTMTYNGKFEVQKPLHALSSLDDDQGALLLDLYLDVNELFTQEQVESLEDNLLSGQSKMSFIDPIGEHFRFGAVASLASNQVSRISGLREAEHNR